MRIVISTLLVAIALSGCATPPPSCDGSDRRPVNQPKKTSASVEYPSCSAGRIA